MAQTTESKSPHFLLVHGALHGAWCFFKLIPQLEARGYRVSAIDLPSHGIDRTDPGSVTLSDYRDCVVKRINEIDGPVVLVGHSVGGIVLSEVAEAIPEKIERLIYLTAYLLVDGETMFDVALKDAESKVNPYIVVDQEAKIGYVRQDEIKSLYYQDCSDEDVALAKSLLVINPLQPLVTPVRVTPERFGRVRKTYISCADDHAVGPATQSMMTARWPDMQVLHIEGGHSPFLAQPEKLADLLVRAV